MTAAATTIRFAIGDRLIKRDDGTAWTITEAVADDYCGDVHLRLSFYKKLATAKTSDQIDALLEELVDRFGKLPPQAQTLVDVHRLRVLTQPYGVIKIDAAPGVIQITFKPNPWALATRVRKSSSVPNMGSTSR